MFSLINFNNDFLFVYSKCFSNNKWVNNYGFDATNFNIEEFIEKSVLNSCHNVQKLIVLENNNPIGFSHICLDEKNNCIVAGGIIPDLINSGKGVYAAIIIYDFLFHTYKRLDSILVTIVHSNINSMKMHIKIGFKRIAVSESEVGLKDTLLLTRNDFSNDFCKIILSKTKYEVQ